MSLITELIELFGLPKERWVAKLATELTKIATDISFVTTKETSGSYITYRGDPPFLENGPDDYFSIAKQITDSDMVDKRYGCLLENEPDKTFLREMMILSLFSGPLPGQSRGE
jgi:hypothetical protein